MPKDITPSEKSAGLLTEVVFCYMSDRQERFGLLLFCGDNMKGGGGSLVHKSGNMLLIDL